MYLNDWFLKGLTFAEYKDGMNVKREEMESIYEQFQLTADEKVQLSAHKEKGLRAIVLTEDWCGDAMLNIPILMHIAEQANIDVRFILRDSNLELMDQYLTNGKSRSIPIFIFIDQAGQEKAVWGPRAEYAQKFVDEVRSELPHKEAANFAEKQKEVIGRITSTYLVNTDIWRAVAKSVIGKLQ